MKTSETTTALLTALCAARLDFPTITRNREGFSKLTGQKYQYADLNAIIDATVPILGQHGLLLVQSVEDGEGGMLRMTSTLFHASSGQWMASECSVNKPDDMQTFGMTCTYLKRYAMQAILCISTEDDDDVASLNGSSKVKKPAAAVHGHGRPSEPVSANGHTPAPLQVTGAHPTSEQVESFFALALDTCYEDPEVLATRLRQIMNLPASASTSKRLLPKTMSGEQYQRAWTYYQTLLAQLQRQTEVSHGTASQDVPASEPASTATVTATEEGHPADPSPDASSSAPGNAPDADATERDRVRLRAEVAKWELRVPPEEVEHVIQHNPYSKARALLWKCRRPVPDATPVEAAAD
jgi:hypothetical protein